MKNFIRFLIALPFSVFMVPVMLLTIIAQWILEDDSTFKKIWHQAQRIWWVKWITFSSF